MNPTLQVEDHAGATWTCHGKSRYVTFVNGYKVDITAVPAVANIYRLRVSKFGEGSLNFDKQFYRGLVNAMTAGIKLAEEAP